MNKPTYEISMATEKLGLPSDLILEFINDFIIKAYQDKEKIYFYIESELDFKKAHALIHNLNTSAKNLSIIHIVEILSTIKDTTDKIILLQNLKSFYREVNVLKDRFYNEDISLLSSKSVKSKQANYKYTVSINKLLQSVLEHGSSYLLLQVGVEPMIRIDGELRPLDLPILKATELEKEVFILLTDELKEKLKIKRRCKFTFMQKGIGKFQAMYTYSGSGLLCSFQMLPLEIPTLDAVGLQNLKEFIHYDNGIVITSGTAGSGISTTTAMMINEINNTKRQHITLLNSMFTYKRTKSLITDIQYNEDKNNFKHAVDDAIAHNSDVVFIDNLDSYEKLLAVIKLAENNILVIVTMNLSSVERVLETLYYTASSDNRDFIMLKLSYLLKCIITQNLLPKIGGGKIAIHDIMINNPTIRNIIKSKKFSSINASIKNFETSSGMESQANSLLKMLKNKRISEKNALEFGNDFDDIRNLLSKLS